MKYRVLSLCLLMVTSGWASPAREAGSILMIAGQSREEFSDYLKNVSQGGEACPLPGGAAFYTSLDLSGFRSPHANVPGDNHQDLEYLKLVQEPLAIQIGLWLSRRQLYEISAGQLDHRITALYEQLEALKRPVFLRIGYEFDGPHNRYPPEAFVAAYRRIAERMRGCRDILLVWHSYAMLPTYQEREMGEWYPGDAYVDWIGLSFFQVSSEGFHQGPNRERVLAIARAKQKPVLIGEASAIRYTRRQKTLKGRDYWDYWYEPFFAFIEANPEIKAVSIINVDWDSQKQHEVLDWGDSRIEVDPHVLSQWIKKANEAYWMPLDKSLYDSIRKITTQTQN